MSADWYTASGTPATSSSGSSSAIRGEFSLIETALDKLPTLTGNGGKLVAVNSAGTALEAITSITVAQGGTGATSLTDGGVLLGSGTNAITAMSVLADGEIIVGDGTTDPVAESGATARASLGLTIGTDVQAYDAATSLTDTAETRSANINMADNQIIRPLLLDYAEVTNAIGSIGGGSQDIDLELGNSVSATVDTSATTFTFSNPVASDDLCGFTLVLTNGGSQTITWPASVDWEGGVAPTLTSSGVDVLVFFTIDGGTTWHGMTPSLDSK